MCTEGLHYKLCKYMQGSLQFDKVSIRTGLKIMRISGRTSLLK